MARNGDPKNREIHRLRRQEMGGSTHWMKGAWDSLMQTWGSLPMCHRALKLSRGEGSNGLAATSSSTALLLCSTQSQEGRRPHLNRQATNMSWKRTKGQLTSVGQ